LGQGVNFGNALEAPNESDWGMVLEPGFFDLVKQARFSHIRLPVSWTTHASQTPPYTVDPKFFLRIDWALEQATRRGLRVVLNIHHYDELNDDPTGEEARALALWKQITKRYKNQPSLVYFEVLNEPHGKFNDNPWLWNNYLAKAIGIIRQSNPTRPLIVGPVGWNGIGQLRNLKLPSDPNLIVTVHYYEPFAFTHQGAEWVNPSPPVGTTWTGTKPDWAGLYFHSDEGAEGYTALAFRTSPAVNLNISCNKAGGKALTTQANLETALQNLDS
jgi:aryl-phospho-beta-D-glucosidase BglC (GH1 family)